MRMMTIELNLTTTLAWWYDAIRVFKMKQKRMSKKVTEETKKSFVEFYDENMKRNFNKK